MYQNAIWMSSMSVVIGVMVSSMGTAETRWTRLRRIVSEPETSCERVGLLAVLAQAHAYIRSGGHPSGAFTDGHMRRAGYAAPDAAYMRIILRARAYEHEVGRHVDGVAADISLALRCSERLGCRLTRCLEAVSDSYRSSVTLEELKKSAFAVPQATVKLLSLLPVGTVLLGEILNTRPLGFLFGSVQGITCLILGALAYSVGLVWMRSMMRSVTVETLTDNDGEQPQHKEHP